MKCVICKRDYNEISDGVFVYDFEKANKWKIKHGAWICWECWFSKMIDDGDTLPIEDETTKVVDSHQLEAMRIARRGRR